jgi:hypothetical protein
MLDKICLLFSQPHAHNNSIHNLFYLGDLNTLKLQHINKKQLIITKCILNLNYLFNWTLFEQSILSICTFPTTIFGTISTIDGHWKIIVLTIQIKNFYKKLSNVTSIPLKNCVTWLKQYKVYKKSSTLTQCLSYNYHKVASNLVKICVK